MWKNTKYLLLVIFLMSCETDQSRQQRFLLKGNIAFAEQDYEEAGRNFDEAIKLDPTDHVSKNNKALVLQRLGKRQLALKTFNEALEIGDKGEYRLNRAQLQFEIGSHFAALDDVKVSIEKEYEIGKAYFLKALILERLERYDECLLALDSAGQHNVDQNEIQINKSNILYYQGKLDLAEDQILSYFKRDSSHSEAFNTLGLIYDQAGRHKEAVGVLNQALEMDYDNPYYLNNRGKAFLNLGEHQKAFSDFKISLSLDDDNPYLLENLGAYYWTTGAYDQASRYLLEVKSPTVTAQNHLISSLFKMDKKSLACDRLAKLPKQSQDDQILAGVFCM